MIALAIIVTVVAVAVMGGFIMAEIRKKNKEK